MYDMYVWLCSYQATDHADSKSMVTVIIRYNTGFQLLY